MVEYVLAYILARRAEQWWWRVDDMWNAAEQMHEDAKEGLRGAAERMGVEVSFTTHYARRP